MTATVSTKMIAQAHPAGQRRHAEAALQLVPLVRELDREQGTNATSDGERDGREREQVGVRADAQEADADAEEAGQQHEVREVGEMDVVRRRPTDQRQLEEQHEEAEREQSQPQVRSFLGFRRNSDVRIKSRYGHEGGYPTTHRTECRTGVRSRKVCEKKEAEVLMKIGIGIGGRTVEEVVAQAEQVAAQGFTSAWTANIFGLDAITVLAIAGRVVPGLHLGTAVVPTFPRHPHAMAQQAMTAWDATGGRFSLGIGLSHQIVIETMFGLSFDKPAVHMREYLAVLLPLLRTGGASFDGDLHHVHAPLERAGDLAGPPVLLAAMAPVMLRLAGEVGDGTLLWMTGPKTVENHVAPRINKAAADAGRPAPQIVAALPIAVTNDVDAAKEQAASTFEVYGGLPSYRAMLDAEGAAGPADVAIVGDEAAVVVGVQAMADAGVTEFNASCFGDGDTIRRTTALLQGAPHDPQLISLSYEHKSVCA